MQRGKPSTIGILAFAPTVLVLGPASDMGSGMALAIAAAGVGGGIGVGAVIDAVAKAGQRHLCGARIVGLVRRQADSDEGSQGRYVRNKLVTPLLSLVLRYLFARVAPHPERRPCPRLNSRLRGPDPGSSNRPTLRSRPPVTRARSSPIRSPAASAKAPSATACCSTPCGCGSSTTSATGSSCRSARRTTPSGPPPRADLHAAHPPAPGDPPAHRGRAGGVFEEALARGHAPLGRGDQAGLDRAQPQAAEHAHRRARRCGVPGAPREDPGERGRDGLPASHLHHFLHLSRRPLRVGSPALDGPAFGRGARRAQGRRADLARRRRRAARTPAGRARRQRHHREPASADARRSRSWTICSPSTGSRSRCRRISTRSATALVSGYDIGDKYALEMPEMLVGAIFGATGHGGSRTETSRSGVTRCARRCPQAHRAEFDELLEEARFIHRLRDERGMYNDSWGTGLARRAMLEAGRRLVQQRRAA